VVLTAGSLVLAAATLVNGVANVVVPAGTQSVGSCSLTAVYTPDSASTAAYTTATSSAATVTVTKVAMSLPQKLQGYKAQLGVLVGAVYTIIAGLKDLEGGFKVELLDSTDHGNNGWKSQLPGLLAFEGSAKLDYIAGDTSQQLLRAAVLNSTVLNIVLLPVDSASSGVESWAGTAIITDWKWDGKNTDLQGVQVTLTGAGPFSVVTQ
jgi:predicted secreted protein